MTHTKSPAQLRMDALFTQAREFEPTHNIAAARKLERQLAALVDQVAAQKPNTQAHADALATHEYMLLSLSRTSKRKDVSKRLRDAAYERGAESVKVRFKLAKGKPNLGISFAAYNLAIDLIVSENRPQEGLKWMLKARAHPQGSASQAKAPLDGFLLDRLRHRQGQLRPRPSQQSDART